MYQKERGITQMSKTMKVSVQAGKVGSTTHNSRNFDAEKADKADHIDTSRSHLNKYLAYYPELKHDFKAVEKKFYKEELKDWVAYKNRKAKKERHPERKKTSEQLRTNKRTAPQETIYQIGDKDNAPSPKEFRQWMNEMLKYHAQITKGYCTILDAAIHNDEATPHAHVREVWTYKDFDENGKEMLVIGKGRALELAGIPLPFPDKEPSRTNNRAITYTRMMREKGEALAKEMGFDIDVTRSKRPHLEKDDYIAYAQEKEFKEFLADKQRRELEKIGKNLF